MFTPLILAALVASPTPKPATNSRCPVLGNPVTPGRSPKVVVRGQEYYLCCAGCDRQLLADPGKYLDPNGKPRNAGGKGGSKG